MSDLKKDHLYAQMANKAYDNRFPAPEGWVTVKSMSDPKTGFAACAYKNPITNEIVISYRGTDDKKDAVADAAIINGSPASIAALGPVKDALAPDWHPQIDQALNFADKIMHENPNSQISVTGHSLGGGLAQITSKMYDLPGTTFDPIGVQAPIHSKEFQAYAHAHHLPKEGKGNGEHLNNYVVESSVTNLTGNRVGHVEKITGYMADGTPVSSWNKLERHSMDRIEAVFEKAAREGHMPKVAAADLPAQSQGLLANAKDKVHELYSHHKLDYDKQHGDRFTLAAAGLAADNNMTRIDMIGVSDRGLPTSTLTICQKDGFKLQTACMPTAEASKVTQDQAFQSLTAFAQRQEQSQLAPQQQALQQEQPQHKARSMA